MIQLNAHRRYPETQSFNYTSRPIIELVVVGDVAQWLGRLSPAGELSIIDA